MDRKSRVSLYDKTALEGYAVNQLQGACAGCYTENAAANRYTLAHRVMMYDEVEKSC